MEYAAAVKDFMEATAKWNTAGSSVDPDDSPVNERLIVKTHESVSSFPVRQDADKYGLHVNENHQIRKGAARGTLFVKNYGDFCLCYTSAAA